MVTISPIRVAGKYLFVIFGLGKLSIGHFENFGELWWPQSSGKAAIRTVRWKFNPPSPSDYIGAASLEID